MPAKIICGDVRSLEPDELKPALHSLGITRIDTAASYGRGESEKTLGRSGLAKDFTIDTKIWWSPPGDGVQTTEAIEKSLSNSLHVLGLDRVNVLYCHGPDWETPIAEQARSFDEQYRKGRFNQVRSLFCLVLRWMR